MRLIDVDALKQIHGMKDDCAECDKELRGKSKSCEYDRTYTLMDFCGWIDDMPTIEERKTGKWLPEFDGAFTGGAYWFRCSECGRIVPDVRNGGWDYCPKCGARNV